MAVIAKMATNSFGDIVASSGYAARDDDRLIQSYKIKIP
jgi:hypothetical protein